MAKRSKVENSPVMVQGQIHGLACKDIHWADKLFHSSLMLNNASITDILSIVASHPKLLDRLLMDEQAREHLSARDLCTLARTCEPAGNAILSDKVLSVLLQSTHLAQIAQSNTNLAEIIFKTPALRDRLQGHDLALVGAMNESIANSIMETPQLRVRLKSLDYGILCQNNPALAKRLVDEGFLEGLEDISLVQFAQHHPRIADDLLDSKELRSRIKPETLYELGQRHEQIAMRIFGDDELMQISQPQAWAKWAAQYNGFAQALLKSSTYHTLLDGAGLVLIAQSKPELAMFFYTQAQFNEAYSEKLKPNHLCQLGQINAKVAHALLDDKAFFTSLNGAQLSVLAFRHVDVAKRVLTNKACVSKLEGRHLAKIAQAGPEIASVIFKQKDMLEKIIQAGQLGAICEKYMGILNQVCGDESIISQLPDSQSQVLQRHKALFDRIAFFTSKENKTKDHQKTPQELTQSNKALTSLYHRTKSDTTEQPSMKHIMKRKVILH